MENIYVLQATQFLSHKGCSLGLLLWTSSGLYLSLLLWDCLFIKKIMFSPNSFKSNSLLFTLHLLIKLWFNQFNMNGLLLLRTSIIQIGSRKYFYLYHSYRDNFKHDSTILWGVDNLEKKHFCNQEVILSCLKKRFRFLDQDLLLQPFFSKTVNGNRF